jgi:hypothetical protein
MISMGYNNLQNLPIYVSPISTNRNNICIVMNKERRFHE